MNDVPMSEPRLYVGKIHPMCSNGDHQMHVRDKPWTSNMQALKCIDCGTTVMVRIPDHIAMPQGGRYALEIAIRINKKEIKI